MIKIRNSKLSESEIREIDCENTDRQFKAAYDAFQMKDYLGEEARLETRTLMQRLDVMSRYMVHLSSEQLVHAQEDNNKLPRHGLVDPNLTQTQQEAFDVECTRAAKNATERIKKIKLWSQVDPSEPMSKDVHKLFLKDH